MAELEGITRYGGSTPRGVYHFAAGHNPFDDEDEAQGYWTTPTTPTFGYGHYHGDDHDHHSKKSVLSKVKDKAKKWKHMLSKKKHEHDDASWTLPWGYGLDEEEEDEQDPEYHGAPMYESEMAPDIYRQTAPQHHSPIQSPLSKYKKPTVYKPNNVNRELEMKEANDVKKQPKLHHVNAFKETDMVISPTLNKPAVIKERLMTSNNNKTFTEKVREMLALAYAFVLEITHKLASKIQEKRPEYEILVKKTWDDRVALKDYLIQRLKPGEDDRALCQVITESVRPAMACRRRAEEKGAVEKVRERLSFRLDQKEPQGPPIPISTNPRIDRFGGMMTSKPYQQHQSGIRSDSRFPKLAEEVEAVGRRAQAYAN
ncbi:uncharacterized protein [Typha latifolia]|uniref:uncharacterized protein n=1 Tax=Typha latifolia TaxID=4733 RepID=UPI003C30B1EB